VHYLYTLCTLSVHSLYTLCAERAFRWTPPPLPLQAQESVVAAGAAMEDMADERFRDLKLEVANVLLRHTQPPISKLSLAN
jgi:hypothetical protein